MTIDIIHLGAEKGVTGSCHLLRANGVNILIDCGLFQGKDRGLTIEKWPIKAQDIDFLFLTHAHIDHIGRLPELVHEGFKGEILCTHPTKQLLAPMMKDALSFSAYTEKEKIKINHDINDMAWGFEYSETFDLKKGIRFELSNAGHIIGSASIRFEIGDYAVVFSGDLGARDTPILPDPDPLKPCNYLVLESTYGDRLHQDRQGRISRLGEVLSMALSDNGKVFIPSFSLGRTQELIYEMDRLFSDSIYKEQFPELNGKKKIPVFIDSPLGLTVTKIYASLSEYWDHEALDIHKTGDHPIDFDNLFAVTSYEEHMRLLEVKGPAIIIAGSGMVTGGRILDHLKSGMTDSRNDIVFVGYQSKGTLGQEIAFSKPKDIVIIDGEPVSINAKVYTMSGYSAHGDRDDLIAWVKSASEKPGAIKLVHGEEKAKEGLAEALSHEGYHIAEQFSL